MLGDFEMWHILSSRYPVVLMPHGIVWYRVHEEQEMSDHRKDPLEPFKYIRLQKEIIKNKNCPLKDRDRNIINKILNIRLSKSILSAFKRYSIKKGIQLYKSSGLNWLQVLYLGLFKKWE